MKASSTLRVAATAALLSLSLLRLNAQLPLPPLTTSTTTSPPLTTSPPTSPSLPTAPMTTTTTSQLGEPVISGATPAPASSSSSSSSSWRSVDSSGSHADAHDAASGSGSQQQTASPSASSSGSWSGTSSPGGLGSQSSSSSSSTTTMPSSGTTMPGGGTTTTTTSGGDWNGLWRFPSGWNWDSLLPPAGITLETSLSGEIALQPRRKVRFDPAQGFRASHDTATAVGTTTPTPCPHHFCVRISITSSYGAMSDFDAFVLDRIESKGNVGSDAFTPGGPAPLVNGRLTASELQQIFSHDASAVSASPYNHKRQTSWVLYPLDSDADVIDVMLSFKQLYTLLPGYTSSLNASSDGPFYSDDPTDQVILRLNARLAGGFSASTLLLPLVLEHKGSRLFDVTYTSELVFSDDSSDVSNQIALDLAFTRKTYGGMMPWLPVTPSDECSACADALGDSAFMECLGTHVGESVFANLLSPESTRSSVDVTQTLGACFSQLSTASASTSSPPPTAATASGQAAVAAADAGLRCFIDSQCPVGESMTRLSDAHIVVFASERAMAHVAFADPDFAFRLELSVGSANGLTTDVISSSFTELEVADAVRQAIAAATGDSSLNITAHVSNNLAAIAAANKQNEALMDEYLRATAAATASPSSSPSSSSSSVSSDGSSDASPAPPSGSAQGGGGSLSGGSSQGDLTPPPQNQRRRLATLPVLVDVPPPLFTVDIAFHNVSVVPIVTAVTSSQAVSWTYDPMTLALQRAPLNLHKFAYVPPPASVFLGAATADDTSSGSAWGTASLSGSCVECASRFEACASDEDCRFGVRTYFHPRLHPSALLTGATAVDLSQVLVSASLFVPATGLAKFGALLACLATRVLVCDVDVPRMVQGTTGAFQPAPPAYLRIEPAKITMLVDHGASIAVSVGDRSASFVESGTAASLQMFLEAFLMTTGGAVSSVDVTVDVHATSRNAYTVVLSNVIVGVPFFSSPSATFEVQSTPAKLLIERQSSSRPPEWQHLLDWTAVLALDPATGAGTTTGGGSGTGSGPTTTPTSPDAVCTACMDKLSACLQASDCATEARAFLQTYVSPANLAPAAVLQPDNTYQLPFASALDAWMSRPAASLAFLELLNCVALTHCAVGYSLSTATATASVPTTLVLSQRAVIVVQPQSTIEIAYGGWMYPFADTLAAADLRSFLETNVLKNSASVDVVASRAGAGSSTRYDIRINRVLRTPPVFVASATTQVETEETLALFVSSGLAAPSWSSLLKWFNAQSTTPATESSGDGDGAAVTTGDVCTQCLPAIAACMSDTTCFAGVRDYLVPQLTQALSSPTTSAGFSATLDGTSTTFSMDMTHVLANLIATSIFRTAPASWSKLSAALVCLASRPCDVGYATAATLPPATTHAPTYLRFHEATADIVLLEGTVLTVYVAGEVHSFTQPANDATAFVSWLTQLLDGRMSVNFPTANNNNKPNVFAYTVEFPAQVGMLPDIVLGSLGSGPDYARAIVTPARLWLESVNLAPSWQKLIDYLSLAPSATGGSSTSSSSYACSQCVGALSSCFSDAECQYVLKTYALPHLRTMSATFSAGNTFATDLAPTVAWNVLPFLARDDLLVDVLKCTAASSCADASAALAVPGAHANVFLAPPTSTLSLPLGAQMTISFEGWTHAFTDSDDPLALASFLETTVLAGRNARVQVKRTVDTAVSPSTAQYFVVYDGLYTLYPPHLFVQSADQMAPQQPGASGFETPWRLEFSSTVSDLARSFQPWVDWLATNAFTAVVTAP